MEEGTKTKKTVFVSGLGDGVDESVIIENFSTFGSPFAKTVSFPTA
jgi:peptidyl-prolyl isomerase E (cyclophilin E)